MGSIGFTVAAPATAAPPHPPTRMLSGPDYSFFPYPARWVEKGISNRDLHVPRDANDGRVSTLNPQVVPAGGGDSLSKEAINLVAQQDFIKRSPATSRAASATIPGPRHGDELSIGSGGYTTGRTRFLF